MFRKMLRRFEKLESVAKEGASTTHLRVSKRFERLEIGDKKIEVAITDTISQEEINPASGDIDYFIFCPYCGKENIPANQKCQYCHNPLHNALARDYQEKLLKRCICGAANQKNRTFCWMCGKSLFMTPHDKEPPETQNVVILNIDGKEYRSTDKTLPLDIRILMERIRQEGYNKDLVQRWIQERNQERSYEQTKINDRLRILRTHLETTRMQIIFWIILGIIASIILFGRFLYQQRILDSASQAVELLGR